MQYSMLLSSSKVISILYLKYKKPSGNSDCRNSLYPIFFTMSIDHFSFKEIAPSLANFPLNNSASSFFKVSRFRSVATYTAQYVSIGKLVVEFSVLHRERPLESVFERHCQTHLLVLLLILERSFRLTFEYYP